MNLLIQDIVRFFLVVCVMASLWVIFYCNGFRINLTPSVPMGVYQLHRLETPLRRGDIVWFCPPDTPLLRKLRDGGLIPSGDCPGNYLHWFKPVAAALPGDIVAVTEDGISINGKLLANSKPRKYAGNG